MKLRLPRRAAARPGAHAAARRCVVTALSLCAALVTACGLGSCDGAKGCGGCGPCRATVTRVVDGDTIELDSGDRVRYLLVDTPETTKGADDCWGAEAAAYNKSLVDGKQVDLAYDEPHCRDVFGRLLAYVSVDGREVNALEVQRGYACVLYLPPAGKARQLEFKQLQAEAKGNKAGVWGACNPVTCLQ